MTERERETVALSRTRRRRARSIGRRTTATGSREKEGEKTNDLASPNSISRIEFPVRLCHGGPPFLDTMRPPHTKHKWPLLVGEREQMSSLSKEGKIYIRGKPIFLQEHYISMEYLQQSIVGPKKKKKERHGIHNSRSFKPLTVQLRHKYVSVPQS